MDYRKEKGEPHGGGRHLEIDGQYAHGPAGKHARAVDGSGTPSGTQSAGSSEARPVDDLTINGNDVSWKSSITKPMALTLEFSGNVKDDSMSGKVKLGMFGTQSFSGVRA
jgi:hypothetical protein